MLNSLRFALALFATAASATVTPLPGASPQTAELHQHFAVPARFVVTDENGTPVSGATVYYSLGYLGPIGLDGASGASCFFDLGTNCSLQSDANGVVDLGDFVAVSFGKATFRVFAELGSRSLGSASLLLTVVPHPPPPEGVPVSPLQGMWWGGPAESGWGMSIAQHGDGLFNVIYAYDDYGNPTWYVMPYVVWNDSRTSFTGPVYSPRGSPYYLWFDPDVYSPGGEVGSVNVRFDGPEAVLSFSTNGVQPRRLERRIFKQDFSLDRPSPIGGIGDMYSSYTGAPGWGIAIMEQKGSLFLVWLTYGAFGQPTWFVMPAGNWTDSSTYEGEILETHGSAWLDGEYDASKLKVTSVGTFILSFWDYRYAAFRYRIGGNFDSLWIRRQDF